MSNWNIGDALSVKQWGARLGQDTIWWKAPKTKPVAYHQDSSFMKFLDPPSTVTCWVTLDKTHREAGTLEYAPGSHIWPLSALPKFFHGETDYRAQMKAAALAAGARLFRNLSMSKFPPVPASFTPEKSGMDRDPTVPAIK